MSTKLPSPPGERPLRTLPLLTFIPGLALLISAGIVGRMVFSFILLVPLVHTLVSSLSYAHLARRARRNHGLDDSPRGARRVFQTLCAVWLWPVADLLHALTYLGLLVGVWVTVGDVPRGSFHHRGADHVMLVTYATVIPVCNMFAHLYLALAGVLLWLCSSGVLEPAACLNCGYKQGRGKGPAMMKVRDGATYSLLGERAYGEDGDDLVRASMESGPGDSKPVRETAGDSRV